jgi:hypothetical protein
MRSSGHSGTGNGGLGSKGIFKSRDVIRSIQYVRSRPDTKDMTIVLFSRCCGMNATFVAYDRRPEVCEGIPAIVQMISDNIPAGDKKLFWIEDSTRRWDRYDYFLNHPEQLIDWFDTDTA